MIKSLILSMTIVSIFLIGCADKNSAAYKAKQKERAEDLQDYRDRKALEKQERENEITLEKHKKENTIWRKVVIIKQVEGIYEQSKTEKLYSGKGNSTGGGTSGEGILAGIAVSIIGNLTNLAQDGYNAVESSVTTGKGVYLTLHKVDDNNISSKNNFGPLRLSSDHFHETMNTVYFIGNYSDKTDIFNGMEIAALYSEDGLIVSLSSDTSLDGKSLQDLIDE